VDFVKSLVTLEFKKITNAYEFLSGLSDSNPGLCELVGPVCFLGGETAELEKIWLVAKKKKSLIGEANYLKSVNPQILRALFGLQKPKALDFFGVVQTKSVCKAVQAANDLLTTNSYLLEVDVKTKCVYFSALDSEKKDVSKILKKQDFVLFPKGNSLTDRYFQLA
jgi:hypothetical protein